MSRVNGKVESKTVQTTKPVLGLLNTVRQVESKHTTTIDLTTGEIMKGREPKILHGK